MADLTQQQIFALGTLISQHDNRRVSWNGGDWVGVCQRGHVCIATHRYTNRCFEDMGNQGPCNQPFIELPQQDALLAAFQIGGWPALVAACRDMIP